MLECGMELRITESFHLQSRKWRLRNLPYILRTEAWSSDLQAEGCLQNNVWHLLGRSPLGTLAATHKKAFIPCTSGQRADIGRLLQMVTSSRWPWAICMVVGAMQGSV